MADQDRQSYKGLSLVDNLVADLDRLYASASAMKDYCQSIKANYAGLLADEVVRDVAFERSRIMLAIHDIKRCEDRRS